MLKMGLIIHLSRGEVEQRWVRVRKLGWVRVAGWVGVGSGGECCACMVYIESRCDARPGRLMP